MAEEYTFNVNMEASDESFSPQLEYNNYSFIPEIDTVVSMNEISHEDLDGRNKPNQHTISSITDLELTLAGLATKLELDKKASIRLGTVEYWNSHPTERAALGELIVYTDYAHTVDSQGNILYIPKIKIGDGSTVIMDLPFVGDDLNLLIESHILDDNLHLRQGEREFWNNKVTTVLDDITNENLIFTTKKINIQYNS